MNVNVAARFPTRSQFSKDVLLLDAAAEVERIVEALRKQVLATFGRRGAVIGLSGGIDSSVVAALCVRAFGKDKVLGLFMPERHSSDDSLRLGRSWRERSSASVRSSKTSRRPSKAWAPIAARTRPSGPSFPSTATAGNASWCCRPILESNR